MKTFVLFMIKFYKKYLSYPLLFLFQGECRYNVSCSQYSYQSIEKYGLIEGGLKSVKRIASCNPFVKPQN